MARLFDKAWKDWLHHNLERGCAREDLIRILLREGFDDSEIRRELTPLSVANLVPLSPSRVQLFTAEDFIGRAECAAIVELMMDRLRPSTLTMPDEPDKFFRRSRTCDLSFIDDVRVRRLDSRICEAMGIAQSLAEPTQAQYYAPGDEFKPHTDYFESYELERFSTPSLGQRSWTFMAYLNEPEGGGATDFVRLGISVRPRTGRAVIWNNLYPDGRPNPDTLHHGTPVTSGYKAIITKWFRCPRSA